MRCGGGGKAETAIGVGLAGLVSFLGRVEKFCMECSREGGGRSKILLVSFSFGRGGRTGFGGSCCWEGEIGL